METRNDLEMIVYFNENEFISYSDFVKLKVLPRLKGVFEIPLKSGDRVSINTYINRVLPKYVNKYNGDIDLILKETTFLKPINIFDDFEITPIQDTPAVPASEGIIVIKEDFKDDESTKVKDPLKEKYEEELAQADHYLKIFTLTKQASDPELIHLLAQYEVLLDDLVKDKDNFLESNDYLYLLASIKESRKRLNRLFETDKKLR